MFLLLTTFALAGYGDAIGGLPSLEERQLFVWTNAARMDPAAFKDSYQAGGCSFDQHFSEDEKTPKDPVAWNADLNEAARFHSDDMNDNAHFAHQSSDGTGAMVRIARFYSGNASENIAVASSGATSPYKSVFEQWMCSESGHRGNIMSASWDELGTGVAGPGACPPQMDFPGCQAVYSTQNFGRGDIEHPGVHMGAHWDEGSSLVFRADAFDAAGAAPSTVEVIVNGMPIAMSLEYGTGDRGTYVVSVNPADIVESPEMPGCTEYYFQATWGTEDEDVRSARFPEDGSYGTGACTFMDAQASYLSRQLEPDEGKGGCSTTASPAGLGMVGGIFGLVLVGRRRR